MGLLCVQGKRETLLRTVFLAFIECGTSFLCLCLRPCFPFRRIQVLARNRKLVGEPWESYGRAMGELWESYGRAMGERWESSGGDMGDLHTQQHLHCSSKFCLHGYTNLSRHTDAQSVAALPWHALSMRHDIGMTKPHQLPTLKLLPSKCLRQTPSTPEP